MSNLLESREPARRRDVALEADDTGRNRPVTKLDSSDLSGVRILTLSELLSSPPAHDVPPQDVVCQSSEDRDI